MKMKLSNPFIIWSSFCQYIIAVRSDMMLLICPIAPILMGVVFKFALPLAETLLCNYFHKSAILSPYYILFDMLIAIMTPMMFSFTGSMVMMDEADMGLSKYLVVTPLGKNGYFLSRLGIPTIIAFIYNVILLNLFTLYGLMFLETCVISLLGSIMGIITSLMIVALAGNKVEAMAVSKLSGITMIGLPVAILVKDNVQYLAGIFPSFWMTKYALHHSYYYVVLTIVTSFIWILGLYRSFEKKIIS